MKILLIAREERTKQSELFGRKMRLLRQISLRCILLAMTEKGLSE